MKINEAIKTLKDIRQGLCATFPAEYKDALQLGVEALKRCRVLAQESKLWAAKPLPGETKE